MLFFTIDEFLDGGDKLDEALGDKHGAVVVAVLSTLGHDVGDVAYNVVEAHCLSLNLLTYEADVRLGLQSALQGDVACAAAHEFDEVPVFAGRVAVALDVTDELAVGLAGCVKTEAGLDLLVLQVAVDGLRAADHLHAILLGCIVLGKNAGVGVGVIATDDHESLDIQLAQDLDAFLKLLHLLQLRTAGTDDVETAGVTVFINDVGCQLHIVVVNETAGAEDEAVELGIGVDALDAVEETADDVVSARSLTAAENYAYVDGGLSLGLSLCELNYRQAVGVGEQFLDFSLITYTLCGLAFYSLHGSFQGLRQLGLVSSPCNLQSTFLHNQNMCLGFND